MYKAAHTDYLSCLNCLATLGVFFCALVPLSYGTERTVAASLNGTDVAGVHHTAIIATNVGEEDTYTEGSRVQGLGVIQKITTTYLVFKSERDGSMRTLAMKGFSSDESISMGYEHYSDTLEIPVRGSASTLHVNKTLNSSMMNSLGIQALEQVGDNVIKPRYVHDEDLTSMPNAIYLKRSDDSLYQDDSAVGIGVGATTYMVDEMPRGVMIGANERNSMLGGYGFIAGDVITEINGHPVHTTEELKENLKSAGKGMVQLSYLGADKTGTFQGYLLVRDAVDNS